MCVWDESVDGCGPLNVMDGLIKVWQRVGVRNTQARSSFLYCEAEK